MASKQQLEGVILKTCYEAGSHIREHAFEDLKIRWKRTDDPVTLLDTDVERLIRNSFENIDVTIYGEEFGVTRGTSDINIYIDPIDGTKSFIKKEFDSSVSVAADDKDGLFFGCVYDFMRDIMYYADSSGSYLIASSKKMKLSLSDMPRFSKPNIDVRELTDRYAKTLDAQLRKNSGSIALSMAQLAQGSYNGLILSPKKGKSDTCDIAAGYYIMKQAGLYIRDYRLNPFDYKNPVNGIIALDDRIKNDVIHTIEADITKRDEYKRKKEYDDMGFARAIAESERMKEDW